MLPLPLLCSPQTSWVLELASMLRATYPGVTFKLVELARRAIPPQFAALCCTQDVPGDTDLVILEYAVNGFPSGCQVRRLCYSRGICQVRGSDGSTLHTNVVPVPVRRCRGNAACGKV